MFLLLNLRIRKFNHYKTFQLNRIEIQPNELTKYQSEYQLSGQAR